jgi:hypothetical protein
VSVELQVSLPDDLASALKEAACRKNMPLAQFIRETLQTRLHHKPASGGDRFASITDLVEAPDTDPARVYEILCARPLGPDIAIIYPDALMQAEGWHLFARWGPRERTPSVASALP